LIQRNSSVRPILVRGVLLRCRPTIAMNRPAVLIDRGLLSRFNQVVAEWADAWNFDHVGHFLRSLALSAGPKPKSSFDSFGCSFFSSALAQIGGLTGRVATVR